MAWGWLGAIYITVLLLLLAGGVWIAVSLGLVGILALYLQSGTLAFDSLGTVAWNTTNSFVLTAVPLFVLMGELILRSGLTFRFYNGVATWVNRLPGGLLHANVAACSIFSAICGSSVATAATIGMIAIPEMESRKYDRSMTLGSLAAGGTLGILIPPSIALIIYGATVSESVSKLFIAGIVPGIMLALLFMVYIAARVMLQRNLAPEAPSGIGWRERLLAVRDVWPVAVLILAILGTIYAGLATPTEAAALGTVVALIFVALFGNLNWKTLRDALANTVRTTSMLLFIVLGAQILQYGMVTSGITRQISDWVLDTITEKYLVMAGIYVMYILLGMFMDGLSMILLTLPVVYPIVTGLGFDSVWFGVILVIMIELGAITPPVGLNLFVIQGISRRPIGDVIRGSMPYAIIMVLAIIFFTAFPGLITWLPERMSS